MKAESGPNKTPNKSETETNSNKTSVSLLKKFISLLKSKLKNFIYQKKKHEGFIPHALNRFI